MQWYASRNREGKTPTELALLKGHHEVAAVLRKFGGEDPTQVEQVRSEFKGYVFATERIGDDNRPSPDENLAAPGTSGSEENDCSMSENTGLSCRPVCADISAEDPRSLQ